MPDGTSRFKARGKELLHFMGCSTFSQYTVVADVSVVAVNEKADFDKICLLGCGITTGYGAATITANVQEGDNVAVLVLAVSVFPLSRVLLPARPAPSMLLISTTRRRSGPRNLVLPILSTPTKYKRPIQEELVEMTDGGFDFTFDCTGNVNVMRSALEACHKGWGQSIIIGVAAAGEVIQTRPSNSLLAVSGRAVPLAVSRAEPNFLVLLRTTLLARSRLISSSHITTTLMVLTRPLTICIQETVFVLLSIMSKRGICTCR